MRRGYWTGFIVGGLLGMVAARAYGNRLMDSLFPGIVGQDEEGEAEGTNSGLHVYRPRGRRARRES